MTTAVHGENIFLRVMSQLDIHSHLELYRSLNAKLIKLLKEILNIFVMSEKIINRTQKALIIKKRCHVKVSIIHLLKEKKKKVFEKARQSVRSHL